jgi:mRNA interferase RelE/StbE
MIVVITRRFERDEDALGAEISDRIADIVEMVMAAETLSDIVGLKKMSGYQTAYRIRLGNYRIGIISDGVSVEFLRVLHRSKIYRFFP